MRPVTYLINSDTPNYETENNAQNIPKLSNELPIFRQFHLLLVIRNVGYHERIRYDQTKRYLTVDLSRIYGKIIQKIETNLVRPHFGP